MPAIQLNDQFVLLTHEVHYISADGLLAAELNTFELSSG